LQTVTSAQNAATRRIDSATKLLISNSKRNFISLPAREARP
jgi:hypothetical protein